MAKKSERSLRLHVVSDLHFEFYDDVGEQFLRLMSPDDADVLVVAGDLCAGDQLGKVLERLCAIYPKVVYVLGNHEYYGFLPDEIRQVMWGLAEKLPNLVWLRNFESVDIDGVVFAGASLWFRRTRASAQASELMSDFCRILDFEPWVWDENRRHRDAIRVLQNADVIVSHHMPSKQCISERFRDNPLSCYFYCDVSDDIRRIRPQYWICGHSHDQFRRRFDANAPGKREVELICHAAGFPDQANPGYKPLVLEIGRQESGR